MPYFMKFAIARMSTKGQIVIPSSMREEFKPGEEVLLVREKNKLVLKSLKGLKESLKDDLRFAARVEQAWQRYDRGEFKRVTKEEFFKMLRKL